MEPSIPRKVFGGSRHSPLSSKPKEAPKKKVFGGQAPKKKKQSKEPQEDAEPGEKVKKVDSRVNILTIDAIIKSNFSKDQDTVEKIKEDINMMILIQLKSPFEDDQRTAQKEEEILRRRMQGLELGVGLSIYLLRTDALIEKYKKLLPKTRVALSKTPINSKEAEAVVLDYLRIAKDYIELENFKNLETVEEKCSKCGSTIFFKTEENGITVCECGIEVDMLNVAASYNDSKRVNCSTRFKHNAKVYLEEAIDCFECKQGEIPEETINLVLEQMKLHGLTPKTVKKDDIYRFLTDKKQSDSYKDINAIYCSITGAEPPDLSEYRAELLEMSLQFEPACKKVAVKRTNALTVLWKLYMFLRLLDYPCNREDFYCLKTVAKQEEHQQTWDKIIDELMEMHPNDLTPSGKARWRHLVRDSHPGYQAPLSKSKLGE